MHSLSSSPKLNEHFALRFCMLRRCITGRHHRSMTTATTICNLHYAAQSIHTDPHTHMPAIVFRRHKMRARNIHNPTFCVWPLSICSMYRTLATICLATENAIDTHGTSEIPPPLYTHTHTHRERYGTERHETVAYYVSREHCDAFICVLYFFSYLSGLRHLFVFNFMSILLSVVFSIFTFRFILFGTKHKAKCT